MSQVRMAIAGFVLATLLAAPHSASAGIIDFIWEMSGPTMVGVVVYCEFSLDRQQTECRAFDKRVYGNAGSRAERRLWLTLQGGAYVSTGKNSDMRDFDFTKARLFAFEPTLDLRSISRDFGVLHHGVIGLSYFFLTGSDFTKFDKVGFKFVPIAVTLRNGINFAYTLRVFPNGFTADEFGVGPRMPDLDRKLEGVHGFNLGWKYNF